MQNLGVNPSQHGLENHGIANAANIFWNLSTSILVEHAIRRNEGILATGGALVAKTGRRTGRSPKDKFIVEEAAVKDEIAWGAVNQPISEERFARLHSQLLAYMQGRDLFVQDCYAGANPAYQVPFRVVTEYAWHNLFVRDLFVRAPSEVLGRFVPKYTVLCAPRYFASPAVDGTNSEAFVIVHYSKGLVIIGGTGYAGEIKKSVFSIMNYLLPKQGVLPMHCSCNIGANGDSALFFGLSGTGKTTLSADPARRLVGDDEHGWGGDGIFNFEGGCYAKCIKLSREHEPQIWNAVRFGAVLENVIVDPKWRCIDYNDASITENTRAAYPLTHIENAVIPSVAPHPKNVLFLSCDAFGVLPPIARLTPEQAMYHFLSGYTAKVAGTEAGTTEPSATFSSCFGAPFLPLRPTVYADLLGERLAKHNTPVWLVNTGWTGGPYGVGHRMSLPHTRALVSAALSGALDSVEYRANPTFGFQVPLACPGVPAEALDPRNTWADKAAFDAKAKELAARFAENFKKFEASEAVRAAGPKPQL